MGWPPKKCMHTWNGLNLKRKQHQLSYTVCIHFWDILYIGVYKYTKIYTSVSKNPSKESMPRACYRNTYSKIEMIQRKLAQPVLNDDAQICEVLCINITSAGLF